MDLIKNVSYFLVFCNTCIWKYSFLWNTYFSSWLSSYCSTLQLLNAWLHTYFCYTLFFMNIAALEFSKPVIIITFFMQWFHFKTNHLNYLFSMYKYWFRVKHIYLDLKVEVWLLYMLKKLYYLGSSFLQLTLASHQKWV